MQKKEEKKKRRCDSGGKDEARLILQRQFTRDSGWLRSVGSRDFRAPGPPAPHWALWPAGGAMHQFKVLFGRNWKWGGGEV